MTPARALHTAARRYCIERGDTWKVRYSEERSRRESEGRCPTGAYSYLPDDYAIFPRYNVLDAILWEVERIEPGDGDSIEQVRVGLIMAGQTAQSPFTDVSKDDLSAPAMDEERGLFCAYIEGLSETELDSIAPLPYRRVLGLTESKRLWSALNEQWGVDGGPWHPHIEEELPPGALAFWADWFRASVPSEALRSILSGRKIDRLWELREVGVEQGRPEYELEVSLWEPEYDGREGYWTSEGMDWLIYASHEGSITLAGDWLLEAAKLICPAWREHLYTGWDHEPPPDE